MSSLPFKNLTHNSPSFRKGLECRSYLALWLFRAPAITFAQLVDEADRRAVPNIIEPFPEFVFNSLSQHLYSFPSIDAPLMGSFPSTSPRSNLLTILQPIQYTPP